MKLLYLNTLSLCNPAHDEKYGDRQELFAC